MTAEIPDIDEVLGIGKSPRSIWLRWPAVLWLGVAIVLLGAAVAYWVGQGGVPALRYVTEPATRGDLTVTVTATGTVEPTNVVEISSELSGTVRSVEVDFNNRVTKGQILARLDTDKLEAQVARSRAGVAASAARIMEAEATIGETKARFARLAQLAEKEFVSRQDLETAKAAYERALASLASAEADKNVAAADLTVDETNLGKACICSSIDGIVLSRNIEPGQTVAASLQAPVLFTLAEDLRQMELQVDIDEADIGQVREGQGAVFSVDAYQERSFPAAISELRFASQTVEGVVTYKAILSVDNSELLLRPGMTATAEIVVRQVKDALLVPNAALRFAPPSEEANTSNGGLLTMILPHPPRRAEVPTAPAAEGARQIWVLTDGEAVPVMVATGLTDGTMTEVLSGDIAPGASIIVDARAQ
jgi:HlyD family secretion protein